MVHRLLGLPDFSLIVFLLAHLLHGLEILDPAQVVYRETRTNGVITKGVILECGTTLPDIYIWGFTKRGTDKIRAVVYNFGKGPKLQQLAEELGDLNVITNSASLSIEKLLLGAEGLYTCQALYDTDEGARLYYYYIYLRVLVPVSKPYIWVSDFSPVEGTSVSMRCDLENGTDPIQYTWEQENQSGVIITLSQSNSSLVNVTWVSRNHTGWYRCLAKNEVNQQNSDRIRLDVIFGPDLPQINVTPYSVTERGYSALEKETVSLMCQAPSNPPSQYVWFYNNSQVYAGSQLTITKILRMHTGNYACLAQNTYLNTRSRKAITLTVYSLPGFNAYPAVIGAAIGGMLVATIATVLLFLYVVRNRNNIPRLHDLIFGRQNSQSRENINFPEDEVVGGAEGEGGGEQATPSSSSGQPVVLPRPSATPTNLPPEDEPVNVTITVMASS